MYLSGTSVQTRRLVPHTNTCTVSVPGTNIVVSYQPGVLDSWDCCSYLHVIKDIKRLLVYCVIALVRILSSINLEQHFVEKRLSCTSVVLEFYWCRAGVVLVSCWSCTGVVLERNWSS